MTIFSRRIVRFAVVTVCAAGALDAAPARAHGTYPAASQMVIDAENPDRFMLRTSLGILRTEDAGRTWAWICLPAYGALSIEDPYLAMTDWNTILVGREMGLSVSRDGGCTFESVGDFVDQKVKQIVHAAKSNLLFAITANWNAPNGVYVSSDGGASWMLAGPMRAGMMLSKILIAPSDEQRVYVAGIEATESGAQVPQTVVYYSPDGGQTWEEIAFELGAAESSFNLLGVDPVRPEVVYATASSNRATRVLRSVDGARTWREVARSQYGFLEFTASGDGRRIFLGSDFSGLFRSEDGGESFERVPEDHFVHCLHMRGDEVWMCPGYVTTDYELGVSEDDGSTFKPVLRFESFRGGNLDVASCAGDVLAKVCADERSYVEDLLSQFDAFRPPEEDDGGVEAPEDAGAEAVGREDGGVTDAGQPARRNSGCSTRGGPMQSWPLHAVLASIGLVGLWARGPVRSRRRRERGAA